MKTHSIRRGQVRCLDAVVAGKLRRSRKDRAAGLEALESRCLLSVSALPSVGIAKVHDGSEIDGSGKGAMVFAVTRSGGDLTQALTVNYAIDASSSATAADDFETLNGSVDIPAGLKKVLITVPVFNDGMAESTETLTLNLTANPAYTVLAKKAAASVKITDSSPTVSISKKQDGCESQGDTKGAAVFVVKRTGKDLSQDLAVQYAVGSASTAVATADFVAPLDTVVIPAGQKSATVTIAIKADTTVESVETIVLNLAEDSVYHLSAKTSANTATAKVKDVPAVNLFEILGWQGPYHNWNYDARSGSLTGTATAHASTGYGSTLWSHDVTSEEGDESYMSIRWSEVDGGLFLDRVDEGGLGIDMTISCDNLEVSREILSGKVTGTSIASASGTIQGYDMELYGTAKSTTTLVGGQTVVVPKGTYTNAVEIVWAFSFDLRGTVTVYDTDVNIHVKGTDTFTFWAVPGIGIVKINARNNESASAGGRHASAKLSVTEEMTSFS